MITKTASQLYAHATRRDSLDKILKSESILSPKQVAELNPDAKINVESNGSKSRRKIDASAVLDDKPDRDKIFLTRNGYDPSYGNYVILKRLASPEKYDKVTDIPNEFTTSRRLAVSKGSATVYVPDSEVKTLSKQYKNQDIKPISDIPVKEFDESDKVRALSKKLKSSALPIGDIH